MKDYEKLGAFYLGRRYDPARGETTDEPLLYDAKDLTTHAVCVGMTGSGKTGLGVTLLEEAAIDGIPTIAIDPKGDMGNLLLTFPSLGASDFRPWIDESDAARQGRTPDEHAAQTADLWRKGLASWDQKPARIGEFASSVDRTIYTPGSRSGVPISVLRSFAPPPPAVLDEAGARRDRIQTAVSGLLGLVGVTADPIRSREHILLSTLLDRAWSAGQALDIPKLIQQIQKPPVERVGVLDVESFYPASDRFELAMMLNNLLASPGFAVWAEGEPLDVARLLHTAEGKPRLSVISIAHLTDAERMFFVTMLLNEVVSWVRSQPGSSSLRAILYMDEIFGFAPPTANPPSKRPMLTLLKQARAHGLGVVLATQNPVDLDYKGLSNSGTWFVGRLQTEQDMARVMDGLEGASSGGFNRGETERLIAGLTSRVFLMNNAHEDAPVLFQTRWALSYLAGPMTGDQITRVTADRPAAAPAAAAVATAPVPKREKVDEARPVVPAGVSERFVAISHAPQGSERLVYRPALGATASLHYANARANVDDWQEVTLIAPLWKKLGTSPWTDAFECATPLQFDAEPDAGATFSALPPDASNAKLYTKWKKMLGSHLYRSRPLKIWRSTKPKLVSKVGETEGEFRARLRDAVREDRDLALEKLRRKYQPKLARVQDQIQRAEQKVETEQSQYQQGKAQATISLGATVVGALFGRKLGSLGNLGRATTTMRGAGRAARQKGDIARAKERVEAHQQKLKDLEAQFAEDIGKLDTNVSADDLPIKEQKVTYRKSDFDVQSLDLVWTPWRVGADGIAQPAYDA